MTALPPRLSRDFATRLLAPAVLILSGSGLAATMVSPAERAPIAIEAASVDAEAAAVAFFAERVVSPTTSTTVPPVIEGGFGVRVDEGIVYASGETETGAIELHLDLYAPVDRVGREQLDGRPGAVIVHGGGFVDGERTNPGIPELATTLAEQGIVTVAIDYRLAGDQPVLTTPALWSYFAGLDPATVDEWLVEPQVLGAAIEDVYAAADWLVDQGVDPDRLAFGGSSAGAVTALYAAHAADDAGLDGPDAAAVVALWGGYALTPGLADPLDRGDAPVWAVHGTADPIIRFDYATTLASQAGLLGVDVVLHAQAGAGHGFPAIDLATATTETGDVLVADLIEFLRTRL